MENRYTLMTKVAITGHMNGLGKAFARLLPNTIGFDIMDNYVGSYDITKDYNQIAEKAHDCDVFINNAYDGRGQILMHHAIEEQYQHTDKLIINISSLTTDLYPDLEKISRHARCRCECIQVPLMNTQLANGKKHAKTHNINADIVAKAIIQWHIS